MKIITEMSKERKINDFEELHEKVKEWLSRAQLFVEMLHLVREDLIVLNQRGPFEKISFGML